MGWVELLPRYESLFRQLGWDSAASFLAWTGILVNQHRHRQVEQVFLPSPLPQGERGAGFFLKKESAVTWRDRARNAWHGFGWCSTAVREGAMLQALRAAGIGCPEVVALGEDGQQAFVLTRDESAIMELRALVPSLASDEQQQLAAALGRELARMHDAGFDHPDLFAKHILAGHDGTGFRFCILDWQRGRRRRSVSWRVRCRDLAMLDATLHATLASDRLRLRCLRAYLAAVTEAPPLGRVARSIRQQAARLLTRHNLREIGGLPVPAGDQQFVALQQGRLLIVRSYYEELGGQLPPWLAACSESAAQACASGSGNTWIQSSGRTGREMPPLAHTLFRLQRFGVPAPRLLAVGFSQVHAFVVARSPVTIPLAEAIAKASFGQRCRLLREAGWIIRQVHEAGYCLPGGDCWTRRLGMVRATGRVVFANVEPLQRGKAAWQELAPLEFSRQEFRLSRTEQLRFLRGYLQRPRMNDHDRAWLKTLHRPGIRVQEGQATS